MQRANLKVNETTHKLIGLIELQSIKRNCIIFKTKRKLQIVLTAKLSYLS